MLEALESGAGNRDLGGPGPYRIGGIRLVHRYADGLAGGVRSPWCPGVASRRDESGTPSSGRGGGSLGRVFERTSAIRPIRPARDESTGVQGNSRAEVSAGRISSLGKSPDILP